MTTIKAHQGQVLPFAYQRVLSPISPTGATQLGESAGLVCQPARRIRQTHVRTVARPDPVAWCRHHAGG